MMYQSTLKVAGGKLLRVKMELDSVDEDLTISSMSLTGDFFLHPEDALPDIEKALSGLGWPADEAVYISAIQAILDARDAKFIGVSAQDIAQAILCAAPLQKS